jgi:hypothetical protein
MAKNPLLFFDHNVVAIGSKTGLGHKLDMCSQGEQRGGTSRIADDSRGILADNGLQ